MDEKLTEMEKKQAEIVKNEITIRLGDKEIDYPTFKRNLDSYEGYAEKAMEKLNEQFQITKNLPKKIRILEAVARIRNTAAINGIYELAFKCGKLILKNEAQIVAQNPPKRLKRKISLTNIDLTKVDIAGAAISKDQWYRMRKAHDTPEMLDSFIEGCRSENKIPTRELLLKTKADRAKKARIEAVKARKLSKKNREKLNDIQLYSLPIHRMKEKISEGSVDLILTDPPYELDGISAFRDLSRFAGYALKDGGSLLCMSGKMYLYEILKRLHDYPALRYHWMLDYVMPGPNVLVQQRRVYRQVKPIFWFVKGEYQGEFINDRVITPYRKTSSNEFHKWGQSVEGISAILNKGFVFPGDTICDPFLGGGSTCLAAYKKGCRFIGGDINPDCVQTTESRLEDLLETEKKGRED